MDLNFGRIPKLYVEGNTDKCLLGHANGLMEFFNEHLSMRSEEQTAKYKVGKIMMFCGAPVSEMFGPFVILCPFPSNCHFLLF